MLRQGDDFATGPPSVATEGKEHEHVIEPESIQRPVAFLFQGVADVLRENRLSFPEVGPGGENVSAFLANEVNEPAVDSRTPTMLQENLPELGLKADEELYLSALALQEGFVFAGAVLLNALLQIGGKYLKMLC